MRERVDAVDAAREALAAERGDAGGGASDAADGRKGSRSRCAYRPGRPGGGSPRRCAPWRPQAAATAGGACPGVIAIVSYARRAASRGCGCERARRPGCPASRGRSASRTCGPRSRAAIARNAILWPLAMVSATVISFEPARTRSPASRTRSATATSSSTCTRQHPPPAVRRERSFMLGPTVAFAHDSWYGNRCHCRNSAALQAQALTAPRSADERGHSPCPDGPAGAL